MDVFADTTGDTRSTRTKATSDSVTRKSKRIIVDSDEDEAAPLSAAAAASMSPVLSVAASSSSSSSSAAAAAAAVSAPSQRRHKQSDASRSEAQARSEHAAEEQADDTMVKHLRVARASDLISAQAIASSIASTCCGCGIQLPLANLQQLPQQQNDVILRGLAPPASLVAFVCPQHPQLHATCRDCILELANASFMPSNGGAAASAMQCPGATERELSDHKKKSERCTYIMPRELMQHYISTHSNSTARLRLRMQSAFMRADAKGSLVGCRG